MTSDTHSEAQGQISHFMKELLDRAPQMNFFNSASCWNCMHHNCLCSAALIRRAQSRYAFDHFLKSVSPAPK